MSSTISQSHRSQSLRKGPPVLGCFEGLLDPLCSVAALIASEAQMLFTSPGKGWGLPMVAVMPVKLMEIQEGAKSYVCIKEVKTCQQR